MAGNQEGGTLMEGFHATKVCTKCQQSFPLTAFYRNKGMRDGLQLWCKRCHTTDTHNRRREWHLRALRAIGTLRCGGCGWTDPRVLVIDHRNGDGAKHRRHSTSYGYFREIIASPEDYQILCINCNHIKQLERSEYVGQWSYAQDWWDKNLATVKEG